VQIMMILSWVHFVITTEATRQTNFLNSSSALPWQLQVDLYELTTDTFRKIAEGNVRCDWLDRDLPLHFTVFLCTTAGIAFPFLSFLCGFVAPFLRLGEFGRVSFSVRSVRPDNGRWVCCLLSPSDSASSARN